MKAKIVTLGLMALSLGYSCNTSTKKTSHSEISEKQKTEIAEGFTLYENNCISCHSPNATMENRVAPPMIAVKKHYLEEGMTLEQFTKDISSFLKNPSVDKSKMPGAMRKFNVMPKMNFPEDQVSKIAAYIYFTEIEKPDWFDAHYQKQQQNASSSNASSTDLGQKIALQTKSILGKNLLQAINSKGTEKALVFCNERAIPLTDSMAIASNAKIKRVSDKNRNPNNKANSSELRYIEKAKLDISKGLSPKPEVTVSNGKQVGYYPILTNTMCLQCHGTQKTDISTSSLAQIKKLYPNDKATGYKSDEIRGIWVVEWDKK